MKCGVRIGGDSGVTLDPEDWQIQPASIDLKLGEVDLNRIYSGPHREHGMPVWCLEAGQHALACTEEWVQLPSYLAGRVDGKSSWARQGLLVHSAGFVDPGFGGQITLELKNLGHKSIRLRSGTSIAQISFEQLDAPAERPYGTEGLRSHYQGQTGIRRAVT